MVVRQFEEFTKERSLTTAKIFLDIKSAYYSTIRQILINIPKNADEMEDYLDTLPLPLALDDVMHQALKFPGLLDVGLSDAHIHAVFADLFHNTWFYMHGSEAVANTTLGTRPGDPLADLLFAISQTPILNVIQQFLKEKGALIEIPVPVSPLVVLPQEFVPTTLSDSTLADDVVLLTIIPKHVPVAEMIPWLQSIVIAVDQAFMTRGYTLNYSDGKSGLIVSPLGNGKKQIQRLFADLPDCKLQVPGMMHAVCINSSYKHLGAMSSYKRTMDAELSHRIDQAKTAAVPLGKVLYRLQGLSARASLMLSDSLVSSALLFNSASWSPLTISQEAKINTAYARQQGRASKIRRGNDLHQIPQSEIWIATKRYGATQFIKLARLRFLSRILRHGPVALRHLIHHNASIAGSWISITFGDYCEVLATIGNPEQADPTILSMCTLARDVRSWKSFCVKAKKVILRTFLRSQKYARWCQLLGGSGRHRRRG